MWRPGTARWPRRRRCSAPAPSAASSSPWSISAAASRPDTCARRRSSNPTARRSSARCAGISATRIPETIVEPGRGLVGNAGVIEAEVVLIAKRSPEDELRWVYLDIGKFHGLAETIDESIRYPIRTTHGPRRDRALRHRRADLRLGRRALREDALPAAGLARHRRQGADRGDRRLYLDLFLGRLQRLPAAAAIRDVIAAATEPRALAARCCSSSLRRQTMDARTKRAAHVAARFDFMTLATFLTLSPPSAASRPACGASALLAPGRRAWAFCPRSSRVAAARSALRGCCCGGG